MRAYRSIKIAAILASVCLSWSLWAKPTQSEVRVISSHVRLGDVFPSAAASEATIDLGNSPSAGGLRVLSRAEIAMAFTARGLTAPSNLPDSVQVVRKNKPLAPKDVEAMIRAHVALHPLKTGITIETIRTPKNAQAIDGYDDTRVSIPRVPRKVGPLSTFATIEFFYKNEPIDRMQVTLDVKVDALGAQPDVALKSMLTLVVKKGYVEVSTPATAGADADIGETLPVTVKASNKTLIATLVDRERAILEAP